MLSNDLLKSYRKTPSGLFDKFVGLKLPNGVNMNATDTGFDLLLYDIIGFGGVEASDVMQALAVADGAPVRVRINSPGGDAFDGFAIYNILNSYAGDLSVVVDGVAASAAAYLAMAGSTLEMQPASFMMIHNAWTIAIGDKNKMATQISALEAIDEAQAKIFANKTGTDIEEITAMLDAETWMSADEAIIGGFAGGIFGQPVDPEDDDGDEMPMPDMPKKMPASMVFEFDKRKRLLAARLLSSRTK